MGTPARTGTRSDFPVLRDAVLLKQAAEQLCVNLGTLRRGVPVTLTCTRAEGAPS